MDSTADSTHVVNGANGLQINGSVGEISTPQEHIVRFAKPDLSEPNDLMPRESEVSQQIDQFEPPQYLIRAFNANNVQQREIPLKKYAPAYVGRALGCTIDLVEASISRRHCVFQYKDMILDISGNCVNGFMIYDLKSTHGTFLNGERIPAMENIKLQHGDRVMLGQCATVFVFVDMKVENQSITSSQGTGIGLATGNGSRSTTIEANDEQLPQPSSTTKTTRIENDESSPEEDTSLIIKYIRLLNQLADLAKEYEEDGLPVEHKPGVLRKFNNEHNKFMKQAQAIADLLSQFSNDDPDLEKEDVPDVSVVEQKIPPRAESIKGKKRKQVDSQETVIVEKVEKRGRKKKVVDVAEETENQEPVLKEIKRRSKAAKKDLTHDSENILNTSSTRKRKINVSNLLEESMEDEAVQHNSPKRSRQKKSTIDESPLLINKDQMADIELEDPLAIPDLISNLDATVEIPVTQQAVKKNVSTKKTRNVSTKKTKLTDEILDENKSLASIRRDNLSKSKKGRRSKNNDETIENIDTSNVKSPKKKKDSPKQRDVVAPKNKSRPKKSISIVESPKASKTSKSKIVKAPHTSPKQAVAVHNANITDLSQLTLQINQPIIKLRRVDITNYLK